MRASVCCVGVGKVYTLDQYAIINNVVHWLWLYSTIEYESKRLAMGAGVNIKNDWPGWRVGHALIK